MVAVGLGLVGRPVRFSEKMSDTSKVSDISHPGRWTVQ